MDIFLKTNEDKGLNVYIELMLKSLAPPKPCAQQRTILATWLLQRYLSLSSNPPDRIRNFLDKHVEILDLSTTMSMLASSGEMDLFLFYAERVEAWDRVCAFLNRVGDTKRLLATLTSLSMNLSEQLLYEYVCVRVCVCVLLTDSFYNILFNTHRYSDTLAQNETEATIRFWMTKGSWLNPEKLLGSALSVCHKRVRNASSLVLKWMESTWWWCSNSNTLSKVIRVRTT